MQIISIHAVHELYLSVNVTVALPNQLHLPFHCIYTHVSFYVFQDKIKLRKITERTLMYQKIMM